MRTAQEIGQLLRDLRKREGVSQTVMAQRCGVTQMIWSRLEHGKQILTLELVEKLARGVPIAVETLLGLPEGSAALPPGHLPLPSASPEVLQRLTALLDYIRILEQQVQAQQAAPPDTAARSSPEVRPSVEPS